MSQGENPSGFETLYFEANAKAAADHASDTGDLAAKAWEREGKLQISCFAWNDNP